MNLHFNTAQKCPRIIAHRGLPWNFPENTLLSYQGAISAAPDFVELDFHTTSDGALVCIHDDKLDRYLSGAHPEKKGRPLSDFTLPELQQLDFGRWKNPQFANTPIALFRDAVALFMQHSSPTLVIEHKDGTVAQLLDVLSAFDAHTRVIVQSFHWDFLRQLYAQAPQVPLVALAGHPITPDVIKELRSLHVLGAHWSDHPLTTPVIQALHAANLSVWVYTLNSELAYRGATLMGIDGITTDRCDYARNFFHSLLNKDAQ